MKTDIIAYYKDRAREYEKIYLKPERQDDLMQATRILQNSFTNKALFEIACGTGFWTERIAQAAASIFATDINETVLEIAKQKHYPKNNVTFKIEDLFNISIDTKFESLFGGFIWSHVALEALDNFLNVVHNSVIFGGTVIFIDNNFVEESNTAITNIDKHGNTFQTRKLEDGTEHLVLKNFPTKSFLQTKLRNIATNIEFIDFKYFWILTYTPLHTSNK